MLFSIHVKQRPVMVCVSQDNLHQYIFFFYQIRLESELSQVRDQPLYYQDTYLPLFATVLSFKTCPQPKCPSVNIWPSYTLCSSLVLLYDHPLISNLINLFYSPSLPVSGLFKFHFKLSKTKISSLPKKHATYPSYTQFRL